MNQISDSASGPTEYQSDQQLPPVEPPAGSFLIQLFLIPLLIVCIIVAVWMMFSWLAQAGTDPQELVQDIERLNQASWQQALTLAQQLRDPRNESLRNNEEIAGRLSELLENQLKEGGDKERRMLRMYLCRALGEFEIDTGYPVLARAAVQEKKPEDTDVRRAALQAIGLLSDRLNRSSIDDDVVDAVLRGTEEFAEGSEERLRRELLRSTATYVLGVLPVEKSQARLVELLEDPSLDVSYNAAIGLARIGNQHCIPVLAEMLNPPEEALINPDPEVSEQQQSGQKEWKRRHIIVNALRSIGKLSMDHPQVNLDELMKPVESLASDQQLPGAISIQASEVLRAMTRTGDS